VLTSSTTRFAIRSLVALLLAVPLVATGGTAQAAACSGSSGVTVIVQFPPQAGSPGYTVTGCAPGDPSSGIKALEGAGFSYMYHPRQPGFVCKINRFPRDGNCMSPKYWSYWHADEAGGSWTYSSEGAQTYDPAPGSAEGWRFDCGAAPGASTRCTAPKPKPAPKPTAKPSSGSTSSAPASASPSAKGSTAAKAASTKAAKANATKAAKTKAAKATAAKAKGTKKAVAEAKATVSAPATSESADAAGALDQSGPDAKQGGGNVPWLWGLVGLVAIGGAAGAVTFARRH